MGASIAQRERERERDRERLGKCNTRKPKGVNSIHVTLTHSLTHTHTHTHTRQMQQTQAKGCEFCICLTLSLTHTHMHTLGKCNKRKPKGVAKNIGLDRLNTQLQSLAPRYLFFYFFFLRSARPASINTWNFLPPGILFIFIFYIYFYFCFVDISLGRTCQRNLLGALAVQVLVFAFQFVSMYDDVT